MHNAFNALEVHVSTKSRNGGVAGGWVVEHFIIANVMYKNWEKKKEIRNPFFHSIAARFKKNAIFENCEFSKRARNT